MAIGQKLGAAWLAVLPLGGLTGCVVAPPPPVPLVAVPGPIKTEAEFRQDDTHCRVATVELPPAGALPAAPQAGGTQLVAPAAVPGAAGQQAAMQPNLGLYEAQPGAAGPPATVPPGVTYLRCMERRGNLVGPLEPDLPVAYGYYPAYPVWAGYADTYPWLYGGYWGFGSYGGRYIGYRRGWYGRFDRFRGGYRDGFRDGGFRGGFRDGGFRDGVRDGGFRGGRDGFGGFRGGGGRR